MVTRFSYKQLQLLRVEAHLPSTSEAPIVPRLKQLKLNLTSQQSTFLVAKY